jgi:hypothetical protein
MRGRPASVMGTQEAIRSPTEVIMGENGKLLEVGTISRSEIGTDERWATLYFDTDACELVVVEGEDTFGRFQRYSPSHTGPTGQMTLREFLQRQPRHRDAVIRLITEKLGPAPGDS